MAMADDRPEKQTMRELWVNVVASADPVENEFLYMTLAGAEGRDIQALIDAGVIDRLETPAIDLEDSKKVVAIESRPEAESELRGRYPGLLVKPIAVNALVRSHNVRTWPDGEERDICRAKVINLDLNKPFVVETADNQLVFPQVRWISKLAQLHAEAPRIDWTLLLTLHAQIEWPLAIERRIKTLLAENFSGSEAFAEAAQKLLGSKTFDALAQRSDDLVLSALSKRNQQSILMTLVPKKIAQAIRETGWKLVTRKNIRYGGADNRAPMISFIFDFVWDEQSSDEPDRVYRDSILDSIKGPQQIDSNGALKAIAA